MLCPRSERAAPTSRLDASSALLRLVRLVHSLSEPLPFKVDPDTRRSLAPDPTPEVEERLADALATALPAVLAHVAALVGEVKPDVPRFKKRKGTADDRCFKCCSAVA